MEPLDPGVSRLVEEGARKAENSEPELKRWSCWDQRCQHEHETPELVAARLQHCNSRHVGGFYFFLSYGETYFAMRI